MTLFRVWAPAAKSLSLVFTDRTIDMWRVDSGWWNADLPQSAAGTDYAFLLDEDGPYPDPRSPWQPGGVHAPSRSVDHGEYTWQHQEWLRTPLADAVIYELHIGTFTPEGSFDAAIERLDHLVSLGVTHVELMPVAQFSGDRGWGYDGVDLYAPHQAYGGPQALKRLVDACHGRGLRVILDVVYNHLGPAGNYLERFGPYFTERYHTPWGKAINYDQAHSDEVRRYVIDNALMWLRDYHFDGLRLDAVHAILDQSAVHILEQLARETGELSTRTGRVYDLIAESDLNDPRLVRPFSLGGYGLNAAWSDDFHHALHALLTGETAGYYSDFGTFGHLAAALRRVYVYDRRYSAYRQHTHGRPIGHVPASRFVIAAQNHDQVGNRAQGERLVHLAGLERARIAAAVLLLAPGVPLLFQGEEWAATSPFQYFTAHDDPELGKAVSEGRRHEFAAFGWQPDEVPDPQALETFDRSRLNWDELEAAPHRDMLAWYQALITLRRTFPALRDGDLKKVRVNFDERERWLTLQHGPITLAFSLGETERTLQVETPCRLHLATPGVNLQNGALALPPDSVAILIHA